MDDQHKTKDFSNVVRGLQVVDGPDTEGDSKSYTTEGEDQNWGISTIKGCSYAVSNFLCVSAARAGALWATEAWSLFLEVHSSALLLQYAKN